MEIRGLWRGSGGLMALAEIRSTNTKVIDSREKFCVLSINLIPLRKATNPSVNAAYNECKATGGSQLKHESQVS